MNATLHIGEEEVTVGFPSGGLALPLGSRRTAREWLHHNPPTEGEMENAIMGVEDEVMAAVRLVPDGLTLVTQDEAIRHIALLAGVPESPEMQLGLDAMETVFDRLSAIVLGRPASQDVLPSGPGGPAFAATLLILREVMHHLKFAAVTVRTKEHVDD